VFVFGLAVGPLIGLVGGYVLFRGRDFKPAVNAIVIFLFLVFLVFIPSIGLALKVGLVTGVHLGLLLAGTPMDRFETWDQE
jgi:NhaP-type Na+/H+ or K+/H+ antiporter